MKTVLVVDDMPANLVLLRKILVPAGYRVVEAASGEEGLAKARREMPDLVLLDLRLGEFAMTGYELVRRFRELPGGTGAKVVALSGGAVGSDEALVEEAGFDGFISKPIDVAGLPAVVEGYLSRGG